MEEDRWCSVGVWNIYHIIYFTMWLSHFINAIDFRWYYVLWCIFSLLVWIGIWKKMMMFRVPTYPINWYCRDFGYIHIPFMMIYILIPKKGLSLSLRKKYYAP